MGWRREWGWVWMLALGVYGMPTAAMGQETGRPTLEEARQGEDWGPALAPTEIMVKPNGFAIGGYDPVAYFEVGAPVEGSPEFVLEWNGATWLFSSAEHRAAFADEPKRFAPQYGGWCAYGASGHGGEGYGAESSPADSWSIIDGKLYLNWSPRVAEWFKADSEDLIQAADAQWERVGSEIASGVKVHWRNPPNR